MVLCENPVPFQCILYTHESKLPSVVLLLMLAMSVLLLSSVTLSTTGQHKFVEINLVTKM